ncbi:MAG: FHA domain-containing protein, partial [Chloroflexota bacterium]
PQSVAEHRSLAAYGGGLFANNEAGSGVSLLPTPSAINTLKVLFDTLANSRNVFTLDYQSASQNLDKDRTINLTVTLTDGQQAAQSFTYQPVFQAPIVKIISPAPAPVRMPSYSGDRVVFDTAEQFITVAVTFPDGMKRGLKSLQLVATDSTTGRSRAPREIKSPPPDGSGNYSIPWTFDDFTTPGTVATVDLTITAVDVLDLSGSAKQQARLTVAALPPAPTLEPTATLVPTDVPANTSSFASSSVANNLMFSVLAAFVLALIVAVIFLILLLARSSRRQANYAHMAEIAAQQPVITAPVVSTTPVVATTTSPVPQGEAGGEEEKLLGRLVTISGLDVNEVRITTPEFTIGRDPACQYVIDQPFISPRHCMIMLRKNTFFIRDLGAKNGTFVNGERLPKNRDIPVPIGSEINITMNISMELWDAKTVVKLTDRRTNATHHSTIVKTVQASDELVLKSVFGIKFAGEDESGVDDDYSPI